MSQRRLTPTASTRMIINDSIMVRNRAPIRYITQLGVTGAWAGGGTGGVGGSVGGAGGAGDSGGGVGGIICNGTGDIDGWGADGGAGDSVVKALTALQALLVFGLIALTFQ